MQIALGVLFGLLLAAGAALWLRRRAGRKGAPGSASGSRQALLDSILNSSADAILTIDRRGRVRSANLSVQALFGLQAVPVEEVSIDRLLPPEYQRQELDYRALLDELQPSPQTYHREELVGVRQGEAFTAEVTFSRLDQADEALLLLIIRDLTSYQATERELDNLRMRYFQQEKMAQMGLLVAGIMHEVGNPLAAIRGLLEELLAEDAEREPPLLTESYRSNLELVLEQTARIRAMTLEISGFMAPGQAEPGLVDLNQLLRNTTRLLRYDPRWRAIELDLALDNQLPAVSGIADQLTQVFMNLLVNASDAFEGSAQAARVAVSSRRLGEQDLCVSIKDNGCGMADQELRQIFEPFFTTKKAGRGTGLGLPICERLIEEHGGAIEVESAPGEGTVVRVYFSLAPASTTQEVRVCGT